MKTDHIPQSKIKALIIAVLDENEEIKKQIIAAGSIVTKDVQADTAVAGVPAKVIGQLRKLQ
ncbi:hypothetical protein ABW636_02275 [Aquimarina sp. 2201CG1-2-11]|uniref:hypothetical protein n=1 Tax=Aquimarina discodermiae TaxID=3231043 RepID=UPI003462FA98